LTELCLRFATPARILTTRRRYCYIVDMRKEIQGGLNISFRQGVAGQQVQVIDGLY
jgi:hypothetical protein